MSEIFAERDYQVAARAKINAAIDAGVKSMVLMMATGGGKTLTAYEIIKQYRAEHKRCLFVVPYLSLLGQTADRFAAMGISRSDIGIIQTNHRPNYARPIQIASAQTLERRELPPHLHLIVIDECHIQRKSYDRFFCDELQDVVKLGLSATPWSRGLGKRYKKLILGATTKTLMGRYLCRFVVYAPGSPDLRGVRTVAGDYHEVQLAEVMNDAKLVADIVATWLRLGEGRPTLVFAVDRAHARHLCDLFGAAGVGAEYIDCYTSAEEREAIRLRLKSGEIQVVCNVSCLTVGVDWPFVSCLVLARPTKSESLFVQMVGRGLRTAPGKDNCLLLDHSDNHLRLGFVDDIHHAELDNGEKKSSSGSEKKKSLPTKCPRCNFLKPAGIHVCPNCNFAPVHQSTVKTRDGKLIELRRPESRLIRGPSEEEQKIFYAELRGYLDERPHYKTGWAAAKYREKFGEWPPRSWNNAPKATPTKRTRDWIRSRQIAYAHRQIIDSFS